MIYKFIDKAPGQYVTIPFVLAARCRDNHRYIIIKDSADLHITTNQIFGSDWDETIILHKCIQIMYTGRRLRALCIRH